MKNATISSGLFQSTNSTQNTTENHYWVIKPVPVLYVNETKEEKEVYLYDRNYTDKIIRNVLSRHLFVNSMKKFGHTLFADFSGAKTRL